MSRSSNVHVHQDNSIVERRLRPIYDWLDSGNNKKALQECEKVLKKTPNLQCAKALKALTLNRMGKESDSNVILENLTKENPVDDATLQAMTLCYREMQEFNKICTLYETAIKKDPTNEELHTQVFMSYVRIGDFKMQQQSAMTLYKHKPKNPYYCWAVMSTILQATRGEGAKNSQKQKVLLTLAERMFDKLINENKMDAEQEVQLYIMVLELLEKYEEILLLLDGSLGTKLQCSDICQTRLKYLKKLNRWDAINVLCKSMLVDNIDRWDIWKEYISSVFELMQSGGEKKDATIGDQNEIEIHDDTPEKAHEFVCRIIEDGTGNSFQLRGPYLARFELCSKLIEYKLEPSSLLGDTSELFIEYFRKFGHKTCCVSDLRIYLHMLDREKLSELATRLIKDVGISATSVPQSEHQMQRHICALQLSRLCGTHRQLSADHLRSLITALSLHYEHGYQNYGQNLLSTDLGPSDPYALLAVHLLYDLALIEGKSNSIVIALMLLEKLLRNSSSNFHAKLLAIRLYHALGAGICAQEMYNSLDVKHLHLDSLGYVHCARLPTTGLFTLCTNLYDATLKFFSFNYRDSSDYLTLSYKFGSFIKLEEFMDFRERLNNSLHYTTVAVDKIILNLVECMSLDILYTLNISPKDNEIDWEGLRDNNDLSVYMSWDPERVGTDLGNLKEIRSLFNQNVRFLKLRTFTLFSVSTAVNIVKSQGDLRKQHAKTLRKTLDDWKKLHEETVSDNFEEIGENLLILPLPSRLHGALKTPYLTVFSSFLEFLLSLAVDENGPNHISSYVTTIEKELDNLTQFLKNSTLKKSNDFLDKRKSMELVVNCVEVISIVSLICMLCNDLIKPLQSKKGKKKPGDIKGKDHVNAIANKLKTEMNIFCDTLQEWTDSNAIDNLTNSIEMLNLNSSQNMVINILHSYNIANKEIQLIIKTKIKMLNSLNS